jgi:hypothetical protein
LFKYRLSLATRFAEADDIDAALIYAASLAGEETIEFVG